MKTETDLRVAPWLPVGVRGIWAVQRFTVTPDDAKFGMLRLVCGHPRDHVPAGEYTRLVRNGALVMSDTPQEQEDHREAIQQACGRVLLGGLGLGMVAAAMLRKSSVQHVTIVEIEPAVLELVGNPLQGHFGRARVQLVKADVRIWSPPRHARYDVAWFDIWPTICADHHPEMTALRQRYRLPLARWRGCWAEAEVAAAARRY